MTNLAAQKATPLRILVVEDQMIIAMDIEEILHEFGCLVVGPFGRLELAVREARETPLDAAILDVNLGGIQVFPVADALQARGIPFIFSTGYGESSMPEKWRGTPRLAKPFQRGHLEDFITSIAHH